MFPVTDLKKSDKTSLTHKTKGWYFPAMILFFSLAAQPVQAKKYKTKKAPKKQKAAKAVSKKAGKKSCRVNWKTKVHPNFKKANLLTLTKWIAKQTCQNFVVPENLSLSPLHIISEKPVTLRQAYRLYFSLLKLNNLAAIRVGKFWKIVRFPKRGIGTRVIISD